AAMLHRKIWVKRPNASATLVQIGEDDLVDDVRDMILRKYANSLGRSFDSPDVTLRIAPRDAGQGQERTLGPEEDMCRTLDAYYPGGQNVNEALIIDVPVRRTPKPSPRVPLYYAHHDDAQHTQTEYFPPMPAAQPSPAAIAHGAPHPVHSIAILTNGGQLPALPSPSGATTRRVHHGSRPKYPRHNTASPTTLAGGIPSSATSVRPPNRPRHDSSASTDKHSQPSNQPIPTPPAPTDPPVRIQHDTPPTLRPASPRPDKKRRRKPAPAELPSLPAGLLDGSVPPINVLIVEDNIINLRVLGAFMQRLKVRWQRAMNGKEAVTKWKAGGFHLVLMDIQLPVMNGLEATKEIRRLERVNSIGVFSSGSSEAPNTRLGQQNGSDAELVDDDKLGDRSLFKSPVIIVALTASSLQSDRHEALAAGCNDFLTKPVNFVWLERKVKEWGCMQALIDFDGWRKWKDFAKDSDSAKDKD
ncbi:CheY-like protein, partial [Macroventuria anomochaeta]